jgi:hypothetical protein
MLSPAPGDSWASMVNTPLIPMFQKNTQPLDAAAAKLNEWSAAKASGGGVPRMGDPTIHKRNSKAGASPDNNRNGGVYGDDGNLLASGQNGNGQQQNQARGGIRNASGTSNNNNNNGGGFTGAGGAGWAGARSPALSNVSSNRFGGNDDGGNLNNPMNGLGMQMGIGGFNLGMGSPGLGMSNGMGMQGLAGMGPVSPFNMNMLAAMGIPPEAQLLAAQMAAANTFANQPGGWLGMQGQQGGMNNNRRGPVSNNNNNNARSGGGNKTPMSSSGGNNGPKNEEDVDPSLLNDVPGWLRSLRLHKYTPNFEGVKWQDMVMMDEAALEAKGVAALGARRKMLKTFEVVRKKMGMESPSGSA